MTFEYNTPMEWPRDRHFYLTLDLECDYGTALEANTYYSIQRIDKLINLLERLDIPLTCFLQTEILDEHPEVVERLINSRIGTRFHPHSHTHSLRKLTSAKHEISESTRKYRDFFNEEPLGYRFPNGDIRNKDYKLLSEFGYSFSASVFPIWRPLQFNNSSHPGIPIKINPSSIVEIPFTTYSPFRIPTGLSYCRFLGRPYVFSLTRFPPDPLIFNIHMHDLINPVAYNDLPIRYKIIYSRNDNGFEILNKILNQFLKSEYSFGVIDSLYNRLTM